MDKIKEGVAVLATLIVLVLFMAYQLSAHAQTDEELRIGVQQGINKVWVDGVVYGKLTTVVVIRNQTASVMHSSGRPDYDAKVVRLVQSLIKDSDTDNLAIPITWTARDGYAPLSRY